jgi:nitroimidazol reductase NimA-like FMN-containing flavoprotein (pyridoxamine 5'-phosphate oxidase superfamily)
MVKNMVSVCSGAWSRQQVDEFLVGVTVPIRLACAGPDGFPRVVSLWFQYAGGVLYCVTHRDSKLVRLLRRDQRVGFEISPNDPPYHGVRGQGTVTMEPLGEADTLALLLERYLGGLESGLAKWLLSRSDEEVLVSIQPTRLFSWDYRERMAGVE